MKIATLFLTVFVLASSSVFAQSDDFTCGFSLSESVKFEDFTEVSDEQFNQKLQGFFDRLKRSFDKGHVINFGSAKEVGEREKKIRAFIAFRRLQEVRITFVNGGEFPFLKTELWIIPPDGVTPVVKPEKTEEFGQVSDRFLKYTIEEFFKKLESAESLKGFIVFKGNAEQFTNFESRLANLEIFQQKGYGKITLLKKVSDRPTTVALWVVPDGADLPEELKF